MKRSKRAEIRDDFIRRLFAVAVSIGFAATLIRMGWVKNGRLPNAAEWDELAILGTGMVATVLSWDSYLESIYRKPLNGAVRFWIDIVLVFTYLFFLVSANQSRFWLPLLVLIFVLYVFWDALTIREHMHAYNPALAPPELAIGEPDQEHRATFMEILSVYSDGFLDKAGVNRGPIITFSWAIYFAVLMRLNFGTAKYQVFAMVFAAVLGLYLYRRDKRVSFRMWTRGLIVILLCAFAALYFCEFRVG